MDMSVSEMYFENSLEEVFAPQFYRCIFPKGSFENKGEYVEGGYNGIMLRFDIDKNNKLGKPRRLTVTDDLEALTPTVEEANTFSLMSPISYCGKSRKFDNARFMYALAIDLDGVKQQKHVENLFWQFNAHKAGTIDNGEGRYVGLTEPTYLVSSGTGIHIYWVFKQPIPMFKNVVEELGKLKERLTWQAWTQGSSVLGDNIQYEPLNQGFRVVGTRTKAGRLVRAFKWGKGRKVSIADLNACVPSVFRADIDEKRFSYNSTMSLDEAKDKYPDWYQERIVEGKPVNQKGSWTCHRGLYDWWLRRLHEGHEVTEGHRYWCLHMLAVYAIKAGIEFEELKKDAFSLIEAFDVLSSPANPFTEDDVLAALDGFKDNYKNYSIGSIEYRTGLKIERNKRNGRPQAQHVKIMTATRDIIHPNGEWRNKDGRPTKEKQVKEWRKLNPSGTKADCQKQTGLSRPTILKWWNS